MALKLAKGIEKNATYSTKADFYFRNLLTWSQGRSYGMRLMLTKVGNPTSLFVVSTTYSPKDTKWVSLCKVLGLDPSDRSSRSVVADKLMESDLITINNPGSRAHLSFERAVSGDENPGPFLIHQMSPAQKKFLGGVNAVLLTVSDRELAEALESLEPELVDEDTIMEQQDKDAES